jgi:hypothetical protein
MLFGSSAAAALFGALLALTSIHSVACDYLHRADDHDIENPMNDELRGLMFDNGGDAETTYTHSNDQARVQSVPEAEGSTGGYRRMQQAIAVDVNFVIVKHTDGRGVTDAQMLAQMDVLNKAMSPDFVFNLNYTQVVTNDTWFNTLDCCGNFVTQREMATALKINGMETLSVYAVYPSHNGSQGGGWAFYPWVSAGVLDGVVFSFDSVPGGAGIDNFGNVSVKGKSL